MNWGFSQHIWELEERVRNAEADQIALRELVAREAPWLELPEPAANARYWLASMAAMEYLVRAVRENRDKVPAEVLEAAQVRASIPAPACREGDHQIAA